MSETLKYGLQITVEGGTNITSVEELLEDVLLDLYDNEGVEAVKVIDRTEPLDDEVEEIIDVIEAVDSKDVRKAIEFVEALSESDES